MNPLWLLAGIVFVAFLIEAAAGFGSMVVALTLGALWFDVNTLLAWLVPVNFVLSCYLVAVGWKHIDWKFLFTRMVPLMALGLAVGTLVATRAAATAWLKPTFGLFVVAVAIWQLRARAETKALPAPVRVVALVGAGVIHGIFATGGPLAVFVSARELPEKARFRATLSMLWVVLNALVLPRLALDGQLNEASLTVSVYMLAPLALGIAAGEWIHHHLEEARFRVVVACLLLVAGLVLAAQSLRGVA